jgi:lipopolysaccharide transport system permease protein
MSDSTSNPPDSQSTIDWWKGSKQVEVWLTLAWFDILLRYRRSVLGPFWLTLSMGAMIIGMGPLYAALFKVDLNKFFPHLALGLIFWTYFSSIVNESCTNLISASSYLKNAYFPISLFVWRLTARITIQLFHHIIIFIPIAIWFKIIPQKDSLLIFILSLSIVIVNAHAIGITLGVLCARFRDMIQIISSAMQLIMFMTPIFWLPESLPDRAKLLLLNPFAMTLELLRAPILGNPISNWTWMGVFICTIINLIVAYITYKVTYRKIVYWL